MPDVRVDTPIGRLRDRLPIWVASFVRRFRNSEPAFDAWRNPLRDHPGWEKIYFSVEDESAPAFKISNIALVENHQARLLNPATVMRRDSDGFLVLPEVLDPTLGRTSLDVDLEMRTVPLDRAGDILVGPVPSDIFAFNLPPGPAWLQATWHWKDRPKASRRTVFAVEQTELD